MISLQIMWTDMCVSVYVCAFEVCPVTTSPFRYGICNVLYLTVQSVHIWPDRNAMLLWYLASGLWDYKMLEVMRDQQGFHLLRSASVHLCKSSVICAARRNLTQSNPLKWFLWSSVTFLWFVCTASHMSKSHAFAVNVFFYTGPVSKMLQGPDYRQNEWVP